MIQKKRIPRSQKFLESHILSVSQFSRSELDSLFSLTQKIIAQPTAYSEYLRGKLVTELFYEPSTRTFASFDAAVQRLGGRATSITGVEYSSVAKGETFEDTILTLTQYSDALILRHPEAGAAQKAADVCTLPVINAGDGVGEHPTQALLDAFTIENELGGIDGKTITMIGDLKHGRTVHSLSLLLANYQDISINFISPESLKMPSHITKELTERGIAYTEDTDSTHIINTSDVLYVTRTQKERFKSKQAYEAVQGLYVVDCETMKKAKKNMVLMHPMPRVGEINPEVDSDPRAAYFRQAKNGMYVRMALLVSVLVD